MSWSEYAFAKTENNLTVEQLAQQRGSAQDPGAAPNVAALQKEQGPVENCWLTVSEKYKIPTYLLFAIAMVESSLNADAQNVNTNGSVDHGYMQINNWWFPKLASYKIMPTDLRQPCVSIHVGAWILAQNFYQMGYSWQAIGAYNARDPYKRWLYAQKVYAMHDMLVKWSDAYHEYYIKLHGTSPAFVPKPPNAWINYAYADAKRRISNGKPPN